MGAWFGIGAKAGTQFAVVGIETLGGYVASLDEVGKAMVISASINRIGPGVGVTGGVCFIYVTGVDYPHQLNGWQQGGWDFNLALGENWGKLAQATGKARKLAPLVRAVGRIGARTPSALKAALKAKPDEWVELVKTGKTVYDFAHIDRQPNVFIFDVPYFGGGIEASVFYGVENFNALWDRG